MPRCRSVSSRHDHISTCARSHKLWKRDEHDYADLVEKIDKHLGFVSPEAPSESGFGWRAQQSLDLCDTFIRCDLHRAHVGPELPNVWRIDQRERESAAMTVLCE